MNPTEYGKQDRLIELKKEYADIKKTADVLSENKNESDAAKMEEHAELIAAEILKLDPNFAKNLDSIVEQAFKDKSQELNVERKKPFKELN